MNKKTNKIFRGRMWKIVDCYCLAYSPPTPIGELSATAQTLAILTDNEDNAVPFVLHNNKTKCPYCDRTNCFDNPIKLSLECESINDMFTDIVYGTCKCKKTGKRFISQQKVFFVNTFHNCIFCESNYIEKKQENNKGISFTVNCLHCHQKYIMNIDKNINLKKTKKFLNTRVESYGSFQYKRGAFKKEIFKNLHMDFHNRRFLYSGMDPYEDIDIENTIKYFNDLFRKDGLACNISLIECRSGKRDKLKHISINTGGTNHQQ